MQKSVWEKEYRNPKLVTRYDKPQAFFLRFLKYLKKEIKIHSNPVTVDFDGLKVLDLGSGTGRNSNYLAQKGAQITGIEISETAIRLAENRAKKLGVKVKYIKQSIGDKYPFAGESFDLVVDTTSSNSLNEKEREIYLSEVKRILKKDIDKTLTGSGNGIFFVRALCKDGDKNAKFLLKNNPGKEKDTYIMPDTGLIERVFSKEDFVETYSKYFEILKMEKTESYSTVGNKVFKRKFWLVVLSSKY
ncbi:class I SAM-dependent methyltransferase [Patescibacteria group bacterium]|nr:class I SAM-dependent methyltransferase [Patescibacteria group bacterium]MCG2694659.1 class I SAM-dependent methyltransferase [Candidatus Parcubacteria bacterium]